MFQLLLQSQPEIPFETIKRSVHGDWFGLLLFFIGLVSFIILIYRNPNVLSSLLSRMFKNDSDKLYFSSPAIDTVDRMFLFVIYFSSTLLGIHFFLEAAFDDSMRWFLYWSPIAVILFFTLPFILISRLVGFTKLSAYILKKQAPLVFLFGLALLPIGGLIFFDVQAILFFRGIILILLAFFLGWMHFRVIRALIFEGFPFYFIFMYFCTLEILPLLFAWVFLTRS